MSCSYSLTTPSPFTLSLLCNIINTLPPVCMYATRQLAHTICPTLQPAYSICYETIYTLLEAVYMGDPSMQPVHISHNAACAYITHCRLHISHNASCRNIPQCNLLTYPTMPSAHCLYIESNVH